MDLTSRTGEWVRKVAWIDRVYGTPKPVSRITALVRDATWPGPAFFVIGPPRTGTTWLYEVLKHRTTLPVHTKETRFFDVHFHRGMTWYRNHFSHAAGDRQIGEIAPTYFASTEAAERIVRVAPGAKVICVFRNPVHRVISLYRLKRAYGLVPWSFEQALFRDPEMLESSKYASRLKAWQNALGLSQVLVTFYEDLCEQPQNYVDRLVDFIGVPRFALSEAQGLRVHASERMTHPRSYHRTRSASTMANWFKARRWGRVVAAVRNSPLSRLFLGGGRPFADLPEDLLFTLYKLFRPEVEALEDFVSRDLSSWKSISRVAPESQWPGDNSNVD